MDELTALLDDKQLAQKVGDRRVLEMHVARLVFGWTELRLKYTHLPHGDWVGKSPDARGHVPWGVPHYTEDFKDAWTIVRRMTMGTRNEFTLKYLDQDGAAARASFGYISVKERGIYAAHIAICKAAILEVLAQNAELELSDDGHDQTSSDRPVAQPVRS